MAKIPRLVISHILAWADAHHARTGSWPKCSRERIPEARGETWIKVDTALRVGLRGLPGGSSLSRLLSEQRGRVPYARASRVWDEQQILADADAYHARTGHWPQFNSGTIPGTGGTSWAQVNRALRQGTDGLLGGSSLARLLEERRGVARYVRDRRPLSEEQILAWADAHQARTGCWPTPRSGRVVGVRGETWAGVDRALRRGRRGLPGGCTLIQLLAARQPGHRLCPLTQEQILAWADAHHERTGRWPNTCSGPLDGMPELKWNRISEALVHGLRGLPGGSSLADLLARRRGVWNRRAPADALTVEQVLAWADAHHRRTGAWPREESGPIPEAPGDSWGRINKALRRGTRGLPGGSSLAGLLVERRGVFSRMHRPELTIAQVLEWADAHHERTGGWPNMFSGPIVGAEGEKWGAVNQALLLGCRGLPGQQTLARLLAQARGAPYQKRSREQLTVKQVLAWARAHRRRTGKWPHHHSGLIPESSGDTWHGVDMALRKGSRGLRGGSSLAKLIAAYRRWKKRPR